MDYFSSSNLLACSLGDQCKSQNILNSMFPCSGPCEQMFHASCANLTKSVTELLCSDRSGLHWYCTSCRALSPSVFFDKIKQFGESLNNLNTNFRDILSNYLVLNPQIENSLNETSSHDDSLPSNKTLINTPIAFASTPSISKTTKQADMRKKHKKSKKKKSKITNKVSSTAHSSKSISSNPPANSSPENLNSPTYASPEVINPQAISSAVPIFLQAMPKPKSIFISRLHPDTTVDTVKDFIKQQNVIPADAFLSCRKIGNKPTYSSFKITVASCHFAAVYDSNIWVDNIFKSEFQPKKIKKTIQNVVRSSPKN